MANCLGYFNKESCAAFKVTAVFIGSRIGEWGIELMKEVSMCCMNFNDIEADLNSPYSCSFEILHEELDLKVSEFARFWVSMECNR